MSQQNENFFTYRMIALAAILCASGLQLLAVNFGRADFAAAGTAMQDSPAPMPTISHPRTPPPQITAQSYLVQILGEDAPILKQRETKPLPPASLTKILTAVVSMDEIPEETSVVFSSAAKQVEEKTSSAITGETFRRDDMIRLMLIGSANDAARALAEAIGKKRGGKTFEERMSIFAIVMNQRAAEIGLESSSFENPNGLDTDNHVMSAADLYTLMEYVLRRYPTIWEMTRTMQATIVSENGMSHPVETTDVLLKEFPALIGGKTGFTDNAGQSLILLYRLGNGKIAAIVLLHSEDRFEDGRKILHWLDQNFSPN